MSDITFGFGGQVETPLFWTGSGGLRSPAASQSGPIGGQRSTRRETPAAVATDWTDRLVDYLRREHPAKTAEQVSARCRGQITAEQVRKWLKRGSAPNGTALLWLATAYGPSLLVTLFGPCPASGDGAPAWLDIAVQAQRVDELGARLTAMRAELDHALLRAGR